jgi:response regulator of citrate/malate metabolism
MLDCRFVKQEDEVPPGWFTATQLAEQFGVSRPTIQRRLFALVELGQYEVRRFRITTGMVRLPVPHYRKVEG